MPKYTTLALVKATLRTPNDPQARSWGVGGEYDSLLNQDIDAAEAAIDAYCGRAFDGYTGRAAARQFPVHRVGVVQTDDYAAKPTAVEGSKTGVYSDDDWHPLIHPDTVRPGHGLQLWRRCFDLSEMVEVTAVWGWGGVPAQVVKAATMYSARLFKRSDSPLGVEMGDMNGMYIRKTDPDVAALLAPFAGRGMI